MQSFASINFLLISLLPMPTSQTPALSQASISLLLLLHRVEIQGKYSLRNYCFCDQINPTHDLMIYFIATFLDSLFTSARNFDGALY
jgi:hypothetical protein